MSKKVRSSVQRGPTEPEWQNMFAAAPMTGTEWEPVLRLARNCGLSPCISRHLPWAQVFPEAGYVVFYTLHARHPARQELSVDLARDLAALPREQAYVFPRLHALGNEAFAREYRRLLDVAKVPSVCTLTALVWPHRDEHPRLREQQRLLGALEEFLRKHLPAAEADRLISEKLGKPFPGLPLPANYRPAAERPEPDA